jgi:hypothetical protein
MTLIPFNGASPSNILTALYRDLSPEQVVSLQIRCDARSASSGQDNWQLISQVLSQPVVYAALNISSLPIHVDFDSARGLEVIGTLANLLNRGGIHARFVKSFETAISESRQYLDAFFQNDYTCAEAYSCHDKWCDWFIGDGMLDETVLVRNRDDWWLLTVTGTD